MSCWKEKNSDDWDGLNRCIGDVCIGEDSPTPERMVDAGSRRSSPLRQTRKSWTSSEEEIHVETDAVLGRAELVADC